MRSRVITRLAWGTTRAGTPVDRARTLLVSLAAAAVTLLVCGSLSCIAMASRVDDRARSRAFAPAGAAPPALQRSALIDETASGRQIDVYWWRVLDHEVQVPGVGPDPSSTRWWVSPGLAAEMERDPVLRRRYSPARELDDEGISHREEMLAYRFVEAGVPLEDNLRVGAPLEAIGEGGEGLEPMPIALASLGLVALPGVGLLIAALNIAATALDRRRSVLHAIGAPPWQWRATSVAHAVTGAAPGAMLASLLWVGSSPGLQVVPIVGRPTVPGDLGLGLGPSLAAGSCVIGLVALLAAGRASDSSTRRTTTAAPGITSLVPLAASFALLISGLVVGGRRGAELSLVGVLSATLATCLALPLLLDRAGSAVAGHGAVTTLVGRRLSAAARGTGRSLIALCGLGVLLPVVIGWVTLARQVDTPRRPPSPPLIFLTGEPDSLTTAALRDLAPIQLQTFVTTGAVGGDTVLVGDCAAVQTVRPEARCGTPSLAHRLTIPGSTPLTVFSEPPNDVEPVGLTFLGAAGSEDAVRDLVVNGHQGALFVSAEGEEGAHESPLVAWILGGAAVAGWFGLAALGLHLTAQAARTASGRSRLHALGAPASTVRSIAFGEAALSVLLAGGVALTVGCCIAQVVATHTAGAALPLPIMLTLAATIGMLAVLTGGAAALAAGPGAHQRSRSAPPPRGRRRTQGGPRVPHREAGSM